MSKRDSQDDALGDLLNDFDNVAGEKPVEKPLRSTPQRRGGKGQLAYRIA